MMWVALVAAAYLLGTFPSASIVARASGVDITAVGSGNPGASNVTRALGWRKGLVVFVLDALKGAIATLVGLWIGGRAGGYVLGAAAILGHIFPVTRRFRGGKGVATGAGALVVLHPVVAAVLAALWLGLSRLTGKAAVASIAAVVATPVALGLSGVPAWEFVATLGVCALVAVRHAGNIRRLLRREEHTLSGQSARRIG
jgi:acyl phosphate:glycerol-3-phosphate acyltransferase